MSDNPLKHSVVNDEDTNTNQLSKRRATETKDRSRCLTAKEFCQLAQGPTVTILVGPNKSKYVLPKGLAEHASPVLERAFNGSFQEADEQTIHFPEESEDCMEMVVQWIYNTTGRNIVPRDRGSSTVEEQISSWIEFAKIGDRLDLYHCGEFVAEKIKLIITEAVGTKVLNIYTGKEACGFAETLPYGGEQIRAAIDLPSKHPVRSLLARIIAPSYITCERYGTDASQFRFQPEIDDLEAFRSDLLLESSKIYSTHRFATFDRYYSNNECYGFQCSVTKAQYYEL